MDSFEQKFLNDSGDFRSRLTDVATTLFKACYDAVTQHQQNGDFEISIGDYFVVVPGELNETEIINTSLLMNDDITIIYKPYGHNRAPDDSETPYICLRYRLGLLKNLDLNTPKAEDTSSLIERHVYYDSSGNLRCDTSDFDPEHEIDKLTQAKGEDITPDLEDMILSLLHQAVADTTYDGFNVPSK